MSRGGRPSARLKAAGGKPRPVRRSRQLGATGAAWESCATCAAHFRADPALQAIAEQLDAATITRDAARRMISTALATFHDQHAPRVAP